MSTEQLAEEAVKKRDTRLKKNRCVCASAPCVQFCVNMFILSLQYYLMVKEALGHTILCSYFMICTQSGVFCLLFFFILAEKLLVSVGARRKSM